MSKGISKQIIAMFAGFAAGVAVGLLFAPDKGTVTRKKLKKNFLEFAGDLEKSLSDNLDDLKSVFKENKADHQNETNP